MFFDEAVQSVLSVVFEDVRVFDDAGTWNAQSTRFGNHILSATNSLDARTETVTWLWGNNFKVISRWVYYDADETGYHAIFV